MHRAELHYDLPPDLIAAHPVEPRDASRLLVLHRATGRIEHRTFSEIGEYLRPGDCLVVNDTRVVPARFFCRRATGGRIEALFLRCEGDEMRVLLRSSARLHVGERLRCEGDDGACSLPPTSLRLHARLDRGEWRATFEPPSDPFRVLARIGEPPLPPYILRARSLAGEALPASADADRYQTVFARSPGAIAAPTAGLHFTPALLDRLAAAGVTRAAVTLHVGAGTFQPIEVDDLREHRMHAEYFEVRGAALAEICAARAAGGRIVAVGTTSARVLESLPAQLTSCPEHSAFQAAASDQSAWTDIFIYPPQRLRNVDALVTNFHLPESTLIALVMAFASPERIRAAYAAAIEKRYRFYSFGDAMLIL